jgi:hypothetical protein
MSEPMVKKLSLSELIRRVGDDVVVLQNLIDNTTSVQLVKGGREAKVTFLTGPQFITPNAVIDFGAAEYVGLVIWLPREREEQVVREFDAEAALALTKKGGA